MNAQQVDLYEQIQSFSLNRPNAQLSYSKPLARDNHWSLEYAQQVIEEYKKFAFLAVTAKHSVTPLEQVDRAWHLHLTYTESKKSGCLLQPLFYCSNILLFSELIFVACCVADSPQLPLHLLDTQ